MKLYKKWLLRAFVASTVVGYTIGKVIEWSIIGC